MAPRKQRTVKTPAKAAADVKTCNFTEVVEMSLDKLLRIAPGNPTIRSQLLAAVKIPLPDDIVTYDGIVKWVETTIQRPSRYNRDDIAFEAGLVCTATEPIKARIDVEVRATEYLSMTIGQMVDSCRAYLTECDTLLEDPSWEEFFKIIRSILMGDAEEITTDNVDWERHTDFGNLMDIESVSTPRYINYRRKLQESSLSDNLYHALHTCEPEMCIRLK